MAEWVFGDARCSLSEAGFSPLTSSSSPPGARGEPHSGRVFGLPRQIAEAGDGESKGEGSVGVGCWRGICNDSGEGSFSGDPGGVVLCTRSDKEAFGSERHICCTLIEGF